MEVVGHCSGHVCERDVVVAVHSCHASAGFNEYSMVTGGWAKFRIIRVHYVLEGIVSWRRVFEDCAKWMKSGVGLGEDRECSCNSGGCGIHEV